MRYIRKIFTTILLGTVSFSCISNLKVEGTKQEEKPKAIIMLGHLENRDTRYIPYTSENFRDMLKFEFLKAGFEIDKMDPEDYSYYFPKDEYLPSDKIGDLPLKFKPSAGENFFPYRRHTTKNLNSKQINFLADATKFTYFIQGAVALHTDGRILEAKESNFIFLNIYNSAGRQVGMINFTIEERTLYEAELLKKLCNSVVKTFQEKIKETSVVKQ